MPTAPEIDLQEQIRECALTEPDGRQPDMFVRCPSVIGSAAAQNAQKNETGASLEIVDPHKSVVVVETVQSAHILLQRALPGDRHGQE